MLEAPYHSHEMLFEQVIVEVKGKASVTEQSDGWCRFDMRGIGLASVMELLCPINMTKIQNRRCDTDQHRSFGVFCCL